MAKVAARKDELHLEHERTRWRRTLLICAAWSLLVLASIIATGRMLAAVLPD